MKSQQLPWTSIFRPGLLARGEDLARGPEKLAARLLSSVQVADLAQVMIADAERVAAYAKRPPPATAAVCVFEMKDILKAVKAGTAP